MASLRFLFIPVSSTDGIGEYSRSLLIANHIKSLWPDASISFLLNKHVNYISECPYPVYPTEGSATKDSPTVINTLNQLVPDFVLFDASGRAKHFQHAKSLGAKIGFISQHEKKRARGLKLNRLPYIDFHWVVQPDFAIKPLSLFQHIKLKTLSAHAPVNIGAVFDKPSKQELTEIKTDLNLPEKFVLFNAGSGGFKALIEKGSENSQINNNDYCIDIMYRAALKFSEKENTPVVVVFGDNYPNELPENSLSNNKVIALKSLSHKRFIGLLSLANARVISAGDTLLQCIALSLPTISAAVTKDQPKRLTACDSLGLTYKVNLDEKSILKALMIDDKYVRVTLEKEKEKEKEKQRTRNISEVGGLDSILSDIKSAFHKEKV